MDVEPSDTRDRPRAGAPGGRLPGVLISVLLAVLVVVAVLTPAVLREDAADEVTSPQELVDVMADARPDALSERVDPDREEPLPPEKLEAFADGPARSLAAYEGTPLVVNFWASWCGPCVAEMTAFDRVAAAAEGEIAFLGVNRDDREEAARQLAGELGISYDLATDEDDSLFTAVGGFAMPTTLLVDAGGTIRHRHTGELDAQELTTLLRDELGVDVDASA